MWSLMEQNKYGEISLFAILETSGLSVLLLVLEMFEVTVISVCLRREVEKSSVVISQIDLSDALDDHIKMTVRFCFGLFYTLKFFLYFFLPGEFICTSAVAGKTDNVCLQSISTEL
jgi:hypothetical protein